MAAPAMNRSVTCVGSGSGRGEQRAGCVARGGGVLRAHGAMKDRMIHRCREAFHIRLMCRRVRVSSSGDSG